MTLKDWFTVGLAGLALVVSAISLWNSIRIGKRDAAKLTMPTMIRQRDALR